MLLLLGELFLNITLEAAQQKGTQNTVQPLHNTLQGSTTSESILLAVSASMATKQAVLQQAGSG